MSVEYNHNFLTSGEIATMVCLAIVTAVLTVGALFSMVECFIPEFITYWKEERKAKKMIKPKASKEMIAELTAMKDKKKKKDLKKNQKKNNNLQDGNI